MNRQQRRAIERENQKYAMNKSDVSKTVRKVADRELKQSDCITINQLNVALDVMTEKYQRLREACRL